MTSQPSATDKTSGPRAPWKGSFDVDGVNGGAIKLRQIGRKTFALESNIHYRGNTGLEGKNIPDEVLNDIRTLDPRGVHETDLASVPGPTRWFLGTYGVHTPAVLVHDRLIPTPSAFTGMTEQYADRFLRFMLHDLGVRWLKRWVMWAAVAMRTRWKAQGFKRVSVVVWAVAALAGLTTFVIAAANGSAGWMITAALAPLVFAGLWGKQYGAGIVAAIAAPWLLPPTVLAILGLAVYAILELVLALPAGSDRRGSGSLGPDGF